MSIANADPQVHQYGTIKGVKLHGLFWPALGTKKNKTILYFHGGGLVYGAADDLPEVYLKMLREAGYDVLSFEYPLAPESRLREILAKINEALEWFQHEFNHTLKLTSDTFILFGRSAGAYLALLAAQRAEEKPEALLLLYGYHTLQEATFRVPSRHYLQFPTVDARVVQRLIHSSPLANGPKETRFSLYIHYRQTGAWINQLMDEGDQPPLYSLSNEQLGQMPPTFLAAATGDPDVPYRLSKKMANTIPHSHLETVEMAEHDFDRIDMNDHGPAVYRKMLEWLEMTTT